MKVTRFDPSSDLIIVWGPDGKTQLLRQFSVEIGLAEGRLLVDRIAL